MRSLSQLISGIKRGLAPARLWARARQSYVEYHAHAAFKIRYASMVGLLAFPSFWVVWTYLVPQPHESLVARAVGIALCGALALMPRLPSAIRRYTIPLSYVTFVYSLPFFFTYMLLMNGANREWQLSAMAAMVYMVFLINTLNVIPASLIGSGLGVLAYIGFADAPHFPPELTTSLPIFAFTLIALVLLNHGSDIIVQAKMRAAHTLAAYIAHEMRTPLASIRMDAETIEAVLPQLLAVNEAAARQGSWGASGSQRVFSRLPGTIERIRRQTEAANAVIDTLLFNVAGPQVYDHGRSEQGMAATVTELLEQLSFRPGQRERIEVSIEQNFHYWGSDVLMRHAIYNLVRNALRAIEGREGKVRVRVAHDKRYHSIAVCDDGPGIPPEILDQLFVPFHSFNRDSGGTGLGLAFCRLVAEGMGGEIQCRSELGRGTTFEIRLPRDSERSGLAITDDADR